MCVCSECEKSRQNQYGDRNRLSFKSFERFFCGYSNWLFEIDCELCVAVLTCSDGNSYWNNFADMCKNHSYRIGFFPCPRPSAAKWLLNANMLIKHSCNFIQSIAHSYAVLSVDAKPHALIHTRACLCVYVFAVLARCRFRNSQILFDIKINVPHTIRNA